MRDQFPVRRPGASARDFIPITPDDDADLPEHFQAIYVGGDGDIVVTGLNGDPVLHKGARAGTLLVMSPTRVLETGTTATYLVGWV